jgi:hypothetical protein
VREAREAGRIGHVGLTSHGAPDLIHEAMDRIEDLETVMFPYNPVVVGKDDGEHDYQSVLDRASAAGVGTLGIKAFAREPWPPDDELPPGDRPYANWYRPVDRPDEIRRRFDFAAARGLTSVVTPGDPKLVAMVLAAAEEYDGMDADAQAALVEELAESESPVPQQLHD